MKVSVLINNYNYGDYLEECINSVLSQTYANIEIIVYDDGSTDESHRILRSYPTVKKIFAENYGKTPNINQMNAINKAFEVSNGDIIFLLDSDDYFKEDKVEKIVEVFKKNNEINAVQHKLIEVDRNGDIIGPIVPVIKEIEHHKEYIFKTNNLFHMFAMTSGLAFSRKFLNKRLPLDEDELDLIWADTRLMQLAAIDGVIITIDDTYAYYRKHGKNAWCKLGDLDLHKKYTIQLYNNFNKILKQNNLQMIHYSDEAFYKNTFFAQNLNTHNCIEFIKDDPFYIWGAGEAGQSIFFLLKDELKGLLGFIDSDSTKWDKEIHGYKIGSIEEAKIKDDVKILISPYHSYNVIKSLLEKKNLIEEKNFIYPYM